MATLPNKDPILAEAVLRYIDGNFHRGIAPHDVAAAMSYSSHHLAHVVKRATGSSLGGLLLERRMRAAAELLTHTNLPVAHVAARVGINALPYFSRKFSRKMGLSPSRYRRAARGRAAL